MTEGGPCFGFSSPEGTPYLVVVKRPLPLVEMVMAPERQVHSSLIKDVFQVLPHL